MLASPHRFLKRLLQTCTLGALLLCRGNGYTDTNQVIDGWLNSQAAVQTWSADFLQIRSLKALTRPLTTEGHITFAWPDRFRWELGRPPRTIALREGDEMRVIYPLLKRVEFYPMGSTAPAEWREMLGLVDAAFMRNRQQFDQQFKLLSLTQTNTTWIIAIQPLNSQLRRLLPEIRIGVGSNNFNLVQNELVFADGSMLKTTFTNISTNSSIPPSTFRWSSDVGYKVVEPLKP